MRRRAINSHIWMHVQDQEHEGGDPCYPFMEYICSGQVSANDEQIYESQLWLFLLALKCPSPRHVKAGLSVQLQKVLLRIIDIHHN